MEEWLPWSSPPTEHPKVNTPATLCQAGLILDCTLSSFPSKTLSIGKCRGPKLDHPGILEEESLRELNRLWAREPERPSFISNLLTHNSMCSESIQLLRQSCAGQFTIASAKSSYHLSHFSPVVWSDLSVSEEARSFHPPFFPVSRSAPTWKFQSDF